MRMPRLKPFPGSLFPVWLGVVVLLSVTGATCDEEIKLEVHLSSGRTVTLSSPVSGDWGFVVGDFTVEFSPPALSKVERKGRGQFRLATNGGEVLDAVCDEKGAISGDGEWGTTRVNWRDIDSLRVSAVTTDQSAAKETDAPKWEVHSVSGHSARLSELSMYNWEFKHQDFDLTPSSDGLILLERLASEGDCRLTFRGGKSLVARLNNSEITISGSGPWGRVTIPFSKVASVGSLAKQETTTAATDSAPVWVIDTMSGETLTCPEIQATSITVGGLSVEKILWANVQKGLGSQTGLVLSGYDGAVLRLKEGKFSGSSGMGHFQIPLDRIRAILAAKRQPSTPAPATKASAKVALSDGTSLDASEVALDDADDNTSWLRGFTEFKQDGFRYWVDKAVVLGLGLRVEQKHIVLDIPGVANAVDVSDKKITITTSLAVYRGDLSSVTEIAKVVPVGSPPSVGSAEPPLIAVRVVLLNGQEQVVRCRDVRFVNFPVRGWTGTYFVSQWPFQWWRSETLEITNDNDGTAASVNIKKLRSIEIVGETYAHKLRLTSTAGMALLATHVWDNLNSDSKHGPSEWDSDREGVVWEVSEQLYVFMPFSAVRSVDFMWPQPRKPASAGVPPR